MSRQSDQTEALPERGTAVVDGVREKASELVGSARGGAGNLQAALADRLDAGAEAMRSRRAAQGEREAPSARLANRGRRRDRAEVAVADRMEGAAMWLRETDVTDLRTFVRHELRTRPGRTALIALGIGIFIGRATRRR
jgi:hypothetical protein